MSQQPKVSVIIPTYNRSDLLKNAIASVQAQTLKDWELVIVDDGSMDDTKAIVGALAKQESRIRYLNQPNAGQAVARNKGVEIAIGTYVAFLDSDDVYLPENLEKKVAVLDTRNDILIVNGPSWIVEHDSGIFIGRAAFAPSNWVVRREFLAAGKGFAPSQRNVEDMGIRIRAANAFNNPNIEYMFPEPLTIYFLHGAQVTRKPDENPDVFAKRLMTLLPDLDPTKKRSYAEFAPYIFSRLANFYALCGDLKSGRIFFKKSLKERFSLFATLFLFATYCGAASYGSLERLTRSLQQGIAWRWGLASAEKKYRASSFAARSLLRTIRHE